MNRLFHTLVVCGAGLTLAHCGGKSRTEVGDDSEDSGGSAGSTYSNGGAGAGSTSGGTGAVGGGTSPGGRGGAAGSLGTAGVSAGGVSTGTGGGASGGAPGPGGMGGVAPTGPSERWTCTNEGCFGALMAPGGCTPDPDRPEGPADCAAGEMFACITAWLDDGTPIRVNCECVPAPPNEASCPCPSTTSCTTEPPYNREECANGESVCGCAITCILK